MTNAPSRMDGLFRGACLLCATCEFNPLSSHVAKLVFSNPLIEVTHQDSFLSYVKKRSESYRAIAYVYVYM